LPAPVVDGDQVCTRIGERRCVATIHHTAVEGAVRYVVENSTTDPIDCSGGSTDVLCVVIFPDGVDSGRNTVMWAVDANGVAGLRSEPFRVITRSPGESLRRF